MANAATHPGRVGGVGGRRAWLGTARVVTSGVPVDDRQVLDENNIRIRCLKN